MKKILLALVILCASAPAFAQGRLVSVLREQILTPGQQVDSVVREFGIDVSGKEINRVFDFLRKHGKSVHCVAISYRTVDPKGREVIASGLVSYPTRGRIRGVVEMLPYTREKSMCGSKRLYATEIVVSVLGHVILVPDNIGYGTTEHLPIAYQMTDNSALVAAHLREAAQEYFQREQQRELPKKTYIFGYSLGAPNALALAYLYASRKDLQLVAVCLGSGSYDPSLVLNHTLINGNINYLIYPGFARSLNAWLDAGLQPEKLFKGKVLEDYERVSSGLLSPKLMTATYGTDVRNYLHPEFFNGKENDDIRRMRSALAGLAIPGVAKRPLPASVQVVIRHSAQDDIVPVACSDQLYEQLRAPFHPVRYIRDSKGTHYEVGSRSFIDLFLLLL